MKKFSKVNKLQVGVEKKLDNNRSEYDVLKYELIDLMDQILNLKTHGSVDNRFLSGSVVIDGKELLADAIIEKFKDGNKKILDSLKAKTSDWKAIDEKIDSIDLSINQSNIKSFKSILERYSGESLLLFIEESANKIRNSKKINDYCLIIESSDLEDSIKESAIKIYKNRLYFL